MKALFQSRYACLIGCLSFTFVSLPFLPGHAWLWPFTAITALLSLVGLNDLRQTHHAVRRNYPILGNLRYLIETIRPEIRQYLIEGDDEQLPFSRAQRSLVYARAKNESAEKAFGTLKDAYRPGFEFIGHSMLPVATPDPASFRIAIGGPQCRQPYSASIFNISAMSFGALSANAIAALNKGAKPGHGGILPGHKVSAEIAETRGVMVGEDCISPAAHSAFSTPVGLPGELLSGAIDSEFYARMWRMARSDSFEPEMGDAGSAASPAQRAVA